MPRALSCMAALVALEHRMAPGSHHGQQLNFGSSCMQATSAHGPLSCDTLTARDAAAVTPWTVTVVVHERWAMHVLFRCGRHDSCHQKGHRALRVADCTMPFLMTSAQAAANVHRVDL